MIASCHGVDSLLITLQTTIQDLIQIKPQDFEKPSAQAIKDVVNDKYSNRIVPGIGLCLCMWDLVSATEGLIGHGTGLVNVNSKSDFTHQVICSHTQLS